MAIRYNLTKHNAPFIHELFKDLAKYSLLESDSVFYTSNEAIKHITTPDSPGDDALYFNSRSEYAKEDMRLNIIRTTRNPFSNPKCVSCVVLPNCMGGCVLLGEMGSDTCDPIKYVLDDYIRLIYMSKKGMSD